MKRLICLWLDECNRLDILGKDGGFLFDNLTLNLSSKFVAKTEKTTSSVDFFVAENENYQLNFFSSNIADVKVIVGNNGTGKTSILKNLFKILTMPHTFSNGKYVLVFAENKEIFYCSSNSVNVRIRQIPKGYKLGDDKEAFLLKDLALFFTPEFKADFDEKFYEDFRNISTDGYFIRDKIELLGENVRPRRSYEISDAKKYYAQMEMDRVVELLINAGKALFEIIPIPQIVLMKPVQENIDVGINDAAKLILDNHDSFFSIIQSFPEFNNDELVNKISEQKMLTDQDREILSLEIESYLKDCYNNFCEKVDDKFLFAGMLSCIRTFWSRKPRNSFNLKFNINWNSLKTNPKKTINHFFKENKSNGIGRFGRAINNIIDRTKFNEKRDSSIVFDLETKGGNGVLREVRDIYNHMYYLYPPLSLELPRPLSSGEKQFICLYSRLYDCLKKASAKGYSLDSIYLLVDEADIFMHPEWQRKWFDVLAKSLHEIQERFKKIPSDVNDPQKVAILPKGKTLNIQIILATHSPFMLTDCLNDNILKLKRKDFGSVKCVEDDSKPLAGNILDILQTGFFLDGTTGELTGKKIDKIIKKIQNNEKITDNDMKFLDYIGNPIMKALLKRKIY